MTFFPTPCCRPEAFKSAESSSSDQIAEELASPQDGDDDNSSDEDGLPPIEANTNRMMPFDLHANSESDSDASS